MMNVNEKFEELFISAEKHDILNFNRQMVYLLRECSVNAHYDLGLLLEDLEVQFENENLCIECETHKELERDQIFMDGERIYLKVCPSCGFEYEI